MYLPARRDALLVTLQTDLANAQLGTKNGI